ncbi:MAG: hypothetical protein E6Q97_01175 [Desulfurellales bacterium]|nr:MAG: hypothetical protein E6Q97_01175 [Desulfurellales bacterium]
MDEIRGLADEVRKAIKDSRRTSLAVWQYAVIVVCLMGIGGGCVAYIDYREDGHRIAREAWEAKQEEKIDQAASNIRQVLAMLKDDPKNYDKLDDGFRAIMKWIKEHK